MIHPDEAERPGGAGRRRYAAALVLVTGLAAAGLLLPQPTALAQTTPVTAKTTAESWFRNLPVAVPNEPVCPPVGGCAPPVPEVVPPSPYAADTLHVGFSGAAEDSRTYVELNLSAVPIGSEVTGGTLTLPVATDPQAGTLLPETAEFQACLVATSVPDGVDGGINGAPEADCDTSSPAVFVPAADGRPAVFTIALAPFAEAWAIGTAAVALVPAEEQAEGASWHVAFSRRDRVAEGAEPISAQLTLGAADGDSDLPTAPDVGTDSPVDAPSSEAEGFDTDSLALDSGASFAAPPVATDVKAPITAPVDSSPASAPQPVSPVAASLDLPYEYPGVFLLPVVMAAAGAWVCRAFSRDLVISRR